MLKDIFLVGIGGLLGSIVRYLTTVFITKTIISSFPFGTFAVNISGCFIIGIIFGLSERFNWIPEWRLFLAVGSCGGFTTFSALAIENVHLLQNKDYFTFVLYTVLSFVLGIIATVIGLALTRV